MFTAVSKSGRAEPSKAFDFRPGDLRLMFALLESSLALAQYFLSLAPPQLLVWEYVLCAIILQKCAVSFFVLQAGRIKKSP